MLTDCLFCKFVSGELKTNIIYEDDLVIAFDDIDPKAPIHKLIIPKRHISRLSDLTPEDEQLIGHMTLVAKKLAKDSGVEESGYRVLMNCNEDGGQAVFHIHMHLLGGRSLTWPPG